MGKTISDGLGQEPAPSMLSSMLLLGLFGPPLRKRGSLSCGSSIFGNRRLCLTAVHNLDSIYSWVTTQDGESIRYMFLLTEQIRFFRVHPCSYLRDPFFHVRWSAYGRFFFSSAGGLSGSNVALFFSFCLPILVARATVDAQASSQSAIFKS